MGWNDTIKELDLPAPEPGDRQLAGHDPLFIKISEGWDQTRDAINTAIEKLNGVGAPGVNIRALPEKSLEHWIVYPLSGDYKQLQANGAACGSIDAATTTWALNFVQLGSSANKATDGRASRALVAQLAVYGAVVRSVGTVINQGAVVFNSIAKVSEKIAIQVEKALIALGKKLTKLLMKVTTRVLSWFGWAILAKELLEKGVAAITDIVDDIKTCWKLISKCFALVGTVERWAEAQAERIAKFREIVDLIDTLPDLGQAEALEDVPILHPQNVDKTLEEIEKDFRDPDKAAGEALDGALDDLVDESGYGDPEEAEPGEDESVMAPGPPPGEQLLEGGEQTPYVET